MKNSAPQHAVPNAARHAPAWYGESVEHTAALLKVNLSSGLTQHEAAQRLLLHGPNQLLEKPPRAWWRMLLDQFLDFMILLLLGAAVVSGVIGDLKDTLAILVIVLLNALIGFVQERRAQQALASLKKLAATHASVLRGGERISVSAVELVPGDIVLLEAGNVLPADLRLYETVQLKVDESLLTGEAVTVDKHCDPLDDKTLPLAERHNLAFKGSTATYGRGSGIVVATGMQTELGKIATMLDDAEQLRTPLQRRLAHFGRRLGLAVLAICLIILVVGLLRGEAPVLMFLTAISLAVAGIPEALPAVVTITLALGARKMVLQQALIRRLPAVETLGSVTYICSDKTGTLTQNKMRVQELMAGDKVLRDWTAESVPVQEPWISLLSAMALCNDASAISNTSSHGKRAGKVSGDPTEVALYQAALEAGYDKSVLEKSAPRLFELPFDSQRKCMSSFHQNGSTLVAYTKGAPELLLACCSKAYDAQGQLASLDPVQRESILARAEGMAEQGMRVLAVAQRDWASLPGTIAPSEIESDLSFVGLIGMMDPPRHEAKAAVHLCKTAGIKVVMITGDHAATALAIARQLDIANQAEQVMNGTQLTALSDEALKQRVAHIHVYARVDPAQKIRIVAALQAQGELVAMTGDGVNDAPALKRADIGVAMGKGGTDVAREAASMVLLDDNFASIVHAVREGRRIFDNIRKFIRYAMTGNSAEIWVIFLAPFLGLPIPLLPIHILWVNLLTDGLPGLALAAEPAEKGIMQRPPRPPSESIFAHGMWQHIIWVGLAIAGVSLTAQAWAIHSGSAHWQTMVFTVLTLTQMGHVMAIRSERESLFHLGIFSNLPMLGAVALTFALQMATIYVPFLNPIFNTQALTAGELGFCMLLSCSAFIIVELEKLLIKKGWLYASAVAGHDK